LAFFSSAFLSDTKFGLCTGAADQKRRNKSVCVSPITSSYVDASNRILCFKNSSRKSNEVLRLDREYSFSSYSNHSDTVPVHRLLKSPYPYTTGESKE
jgi:hypothetical protein